MNWNGTEIKQILRAFRLEDVRRAAKAVDLI